MKHLDFESIGFFPVIICLLETSTRKRLGFSQFYIDNPTRVSARGMVVMWLDYIQIANISSNDTIIDMEIVGIDRATIKEFERIATLSWKLFILGFSLVILMNFE